MTESENIAKYGLKAWMDGNGVTVDQLAKAGGVTPATVRNWRSGRTEMGTFTRLGIGAWFERLDDDRLDDENEIVKDGVRYIFKDSGKLLFDDCYKCQECFDYCCSWERKDGKDGYWVRAE